MALTPEISHALAEIASSLELTPELRAQIFSRVPEDATSEADLPDDLQWLLGEIRRERAPVAAAARTLSLAGRPLAFSTAVLESRVSACGPDMPHLDADDDGEQMMAAALPQHWRGQLVPYNIAAPDGRIIKAPAGEPKSREMPLPFNAQVATADGHDNAVTIGRVNRIWTQDGALWGEGEFDLGTPQGRDWAGRVARSMAGWGSVDLDAGTAPRVESQGRNKVPKRTYPDWTFAGFTLVSRPAFDSARITAWPGDEETIDDERNTQMPGEVEELLSSVDEMFDVQDGDVAASSGGCGCGGAAEPAQTFPGGGKPYLPMAPHDYPWNPSEAVARVREWAGITGEDDTPPQAWEAMGEAFFWHDQDDDSFKLPFADVIDEQLTAVPAAVHAAARMVHSGRAGIPETDLEPVRSKISAYFREMNMTPPWGNTTEASAADTVLTFPASGKTSLPLGPPTDWDSSLANKRVRAWAGIDADNPSPAAWAKYGQAHFWHTPGAAKLADFKLPFADLVDGQLRAMPRGVFAAAAALQGSRGGVDIPQADVPKVRAKIGAYYRKMKRNAPWDVRPMTAAAEGGLVYTTEGVAGTVTGYDADAGWLRISSSPHAAVIVAADSLDPQYLSAAASGPAAPPDEWFANPGLSGPTGLAVDDDGRVYGHLATWGTCHVGFSDVCVTPPRSHTGYSYFHTGEIVTATGARLPVGKIVIGPGHAGPYAGWRAATMHYDKSGATIAIGRVGEDAYGIWFSGTLVPEIKPAQVASLRRSPLSGDWRKIGGNLELVAALAVSVPGFPIPRPRASLTYGQQTALVAAGVIDREQLALHTSLGQIVETALENALDAYADRRQRAAAAMARIQGGDDGGCGCGEYHDEEDDEE